MKQALLASVLMASAVSCASPAGRAAPGTANCPLGTPPAYSNGFLAQIGRDTGTGYGIRDIGRSGKTVLDLADCSFAPTVLRGAPWQMLTIYVTNGSSALHNFSVPSESVGVDVPPGATIPVTVQVPGSGGVEFICRFHRNAGMIGAVEVHGAGLSEVLPAPPGDLAYGSVGSGAYRGVGHIGPGTTDLGGNTPKPQPSGKPADGKNY